MNHYSSVRRADGFTLAELIVATTLMTIVMTAVYVAFGSTLRSWRLAETQVQTFQDVRYAMGIMSRELNSVLGGTEHLFEGKHNEFEFITVGLPMNVEKEEGARVLWVRYHLDRAKKALVRQEAEIKAPLPPAPESGQRFDRGRIKKGRSHSFVMASGVRDFEVRYQWIPLSEIKPGQPPAWVNPVVMDKNKVGWGLPQGISVSFAVDDSTAESERVAFKYALAFRGPTTPYYEGRLKDTDEGEL